MGEERGREKEVGKKRDEEMEKEGRRRRVREVKGVQMEK